VPGKQAAREYARAIMHHAPELSETIIKLFRRIIDERARDTKYNRLLLHSVISTEEKIAATADLAGDNLPDVVKKILIDLINHRGMDLLPEIVGFLVKMREEAEGVVEAEVFSPVPLTEEQKVKICAGIGASTRKKPLVKYSIDRSLIAGYKIRIGDQVMDNSVRRQLELIGDQLTAATRM